MKLEFAVDDGDLLVTVDNEPIGDPFDPDDPDCIDMVLEQVGDRLYEFLAVLNAAA